MTPPRSILFALPPLLGPGAQRESLVSYLVRLARAHQVEVRPMVRELIWPQLAQGSVQPHAPFFRHQARTLNGVGRYAAAFARGLGQLTAVPDLAQLTLLPWSGVIPPQSPGLLANEVRWCPACLAEQRENGQESYFPLLWSLEHYRVCLRHHRPLESRCPWCNCPQDFIPYYPEQARCTHCFGFLAPVSSLAVSTTVAPRELRWAQLLQSMTSTAAFDAAYSLDRLLLTLTHAAERWSDGEMQRLSLMMGLGYKAISGWSSKRQKPAFPLLLQVAEALNVPVAELFSGDRAVERPKKPDGLLTLKPRGSSALSLSELGQRLQDLLATEQGQHPVSVLLRQLGVSRSYAKYWFPEQVVELGLRHKAWQRRQTRVSQSQEIALGRQAVAEIVSNDLYPSGRRVREVFRRHRLSLLRPYLRQAYLGWRDALR
ncbi:TniQ family protein [Paludibacterium sp. B53371]|uniref:TniQ family protein n=1 Tax=Paludibacterium sp. B53371 TaxID=2806263 RepID=UPI001C05CF3D|nr:TniQ family protein [Paludibacterium sp. B53371]